jgi:hypothetical protein
MDRPYQLIHNKGKRLQMMVLLIRTLAMFLDPVMLVIAFIAAGCIRPIWGLFLAGVGVGIVSRIGVSALGGRVDEVAVICAILAGIAQVMLFSWLWRVIRARRAKRGVPA